MEKRETALDRSWRKVQVILGRETAVSHIFGAKARANVPIASFPTDCKCDCIRSGLTVDLLYLRMFFSVENESHCFFFSLTLLGLQPRSGDKLPRISVLCP